MIETEAVTFMRALVAFRAELEALRAAAPHQSQPDAGDTGLLKALHDAFPADSFTSAEVVVQAESVPALAAELRLARLGSTKSIGNRLARILARQRGDTPLVLARLTRASAGALWAVDEKVGAAGASGATPAALSHLACRRIGT